jgi:hypothetical protein
MNGEGMKKTAVLLFFNFFVSVSGYPGTQIPLKDKVQPKSTEIIKPAVPSPTAVSNITSQKDKPIPVYQKSTVFNKKSTGTQTDSGLGLEGYFQGLDKDQKETFYNQLNANLFSSLSSQPKPLTPEEKVLGTIGAIASYGCAAGAAAQVLGIIPDGKTKKKK